MNTKLIAEIFYYFVLILLVLSAVWVMFDCRRRGRPWGETLVWGLFTGAFFGLGFVLYILWKKKFK
ncbi:MAG: hypothetical protein ACOY31_09665 [Bacillota bacterium]